ncbi:MAG: serine hydrolase [Burkholderiaceae bacterium]
MTKNTKNLSPAWCDVVSFAAANECPWAKDPTDDGASWGIHLKDPPPHNRLLGPVFKRGPASGIVQVAGKTCCEWGEPDRADMTFSVTKTYLALVAGVAFDQGLIPDPDEAVYLRVPGLGFDDEHNRAVTWAQLLQFTSEWQGSCFGVPDSVDHHRRAGFQGEPAPGTPPKGTERQRQQPGSFWEYNDVRINQFGLALLHLFKKPLPQVLAESIMEPLGTSDTWRWHGYDNSWVSIDGVKMQSVPGGGHWGGGMQICARDQALVGELMLAGGRHGNRQLVSEQWISLMRTPCAIAPFYGFFTWLNQGPHPLVNASPESFFALGIGGQTVWHDPTRQMVAVFRWTDVSALDELMGLVNKALA